MEEIVNKVAKSALITIDLDDYISQSERVSFDIKQGLFQEILLREKDFRTFIKAFDWEQFRHKNVNVICSVDTIVPSWAYMLVASKLSSVANVVVFGDESDLEKAVINQAIDQLLKSNELTGAKVVIKGCGDLSNRDYAYFEVSRRLCPLVSSMMYGEPCSTVPVYKTPR